MTNEDKKSQIEYLQRSKIITAIESVAINTFGIFLLMISHYSVTSTKFQLAIMVIVFTMVASFGIYAVTRNTQKRSQIRKLLR